MYLGDAAFVLRMQALATDRAVSDKAIPRTQRAHPKTLQDWQAELPDRDAAILAAHRQSHWSLTRIAQALGLSVSRVSRIVAKAEQREEAAAMPPRGTS
jgi:DNA-directed RNA polymerase specialized sigma subunit